MKTFLIQNSKFIILIAILLASSPYRLIADDYTLVWNEVCMAHIGNTGIILYNTVEVRLCKDNTCHIVGSKLCLKICKVGNAILLSDSLNAL